MLGLQHALIAAMGWLESRSDEERGAAAVEYGLLVALIAAVVIASVAFLGTRTLGGYNSVTANFPD